MPLTLRMGSSDLTQKAVNPRVKKTSITKITKAAKGGRKISISNLKPKATPKGNDDNSSKSSKFDLQDLRWINNMSECPVYRPSEQEFEDPLSYLQRISPEASNYGICKIVSPISTAAPSGAVLLREKKDFKFEPNVQPLRLSEWSGDDKIVFSLRGRKYTYREFESMANTDFVSRFYSSAGLPSLYIEKEFWLEMARGEKSTVEYGVNVDGSAFSSSSIDQLANSKWNLKNFSRMENSTLRLIEEVIPGITDPMLYIGMVFSMFAWHVEDHYLYSINYHHSGAAKTWYGVPGLAAPLFEKVVLDHVYSSEILSESGVDGASKLLAEKTTMFPPNLLLQHGVPVYKAVQMPGEFVITFPRAYHAGFSHGFNCGEAVNFAIGDWFPMGAAARRRYAYLRVLPIIPYEELLCKEAMLLSNKSSRFGGSEQPAQPLVSNHGMKESFVQLMHCHKQALHKLEQIRKLPISFDSLGTLTCSQCFRDCYLGYMLCSHCYSHPICLFHEVESLTCSCGQECTIFLRDDLQDMEDAAFRFQKEGNDLMDAKGVTNHREMRSPVNIFSCTGDGDIKYLKDALNGTVKRGTKRSADLVESGPLELNAGKCHERRRWKLKLQYLK